VRNLTRKKLGYGIGSKGYDQKDEANADLLLAVQQVFKELSHQEIWRQRNPTLRSRRAQRVLYAAIRRRCQPRDGPKRLADFIVVVLGQWPYGPIGIEYDPEEHFNFTRKQAIIQEYLGLTAGQRTEEACDLRRLLNRIISHVELRTPLLRLEHAARTRTKGHANLGRVLLRVFKEIRHNPSKQQRVTEEMLLHWPEVRRMLREKQAASLASSLNAKLKLIPPQDFDRAPEGKSSVEVMIRRAYNKLKRVSRLLV